MRTTPSLAAAVAALATIVGPGCVTIVGSARYVETVEKRFEVSGKADVSLATFDGSIEIRPSSSNAVVVTVEKRGASKDVTDRIEVRADQNGNKVTVDVRYPKHDHMFSWGDGASAKLVVAIPAQADVQAQTGDGGIDVERLTGTLDLRSGDGSISGHDLGGSVRAHTGDGSIRLGGVKGALDVDTGDGSITVEGTFTSVRARSGDGSVNVHAASGSSASEEWSIATGDGSVLLALPGDFGAELDAHSSDGSIEMRDVTLSNVTGTISKQTIRGRLGNGGAVLKVRTGDGTITLRRS